MASGTDKRKHPRFKLALPVEVKMGSEAQMATSTSDVSAAGVCFTMAQECEVGSELEWELTLPSELSQGRPVRIRCVGKVVRVDRPQARGRIGVAATIERYEFLRVE